MPLTVPRVEPLEHQACRQRTDEERTALEGCPVCFNTGHVCENHPGKVWNDPRGCSCGAGIPCQSCCDAIPEDGTGRIGDAFTPRHLKD